MFDSNVTTMRNVTVRMMLNERCKYVYPTAIALSTYFYTLCNERCNQDDAKLISRTAQYSIDVRSKVPDRVYNYIVTDN